MYKDFEVNEWLELLNNQDVFKYDNILIMRRFADIGGEATCSQLANTYGGSWGYYNSMCSKLAKRIADFKQIELNKRPDGQEIRWPVLFTGRNVSVKDDIDGSFIWILKPNLRKALENLDLNKYEPLYELSEFDRLYEEFNQRFPIEKLQSITLEEYTNLGGDYFCNWVERKVRKLGSIQGSPSFKFGIYKYKKTPKVRPGQMHDEEYAWLSKFGEKRDDVYLNVREELVQIAQAARSGNFEIVDNSKLSPMFKWKVAFLYSEKKLIPIYDRKMLEYIALQKGMNDAKSAKISQIQNFLLKHPNRNPDLWAYYKDLLEIWKKKEPQYFVAKITGAPKILDQAVNGKYWAMQQRYGVQKSAAVTNNLRPILQMRTGDVLLLGDENRLLAYGTVKQADYETESVLSLKDVIDNKDYGDVQDDEYVTFEDCEVYYEKRYNGYEDGWSQFIDVEEWKSLCRNSQVTTSGVGDASDISVSSIFQIKDSKWARAKMSELDDQFNKMKPENVKMVDEVKTLLLANHNIILHGAPGTGKTYLAKEIAMAMGCGEDEIGFVQFHQSYDYTDFVEGLRPIQKESAEIGFERKDGVFKSFCRRVIKGVEKIASGLNEDEAIEAFKVEVKQSGTEGLIVKSIRSETTFTVTVNEKGTLFATNQKGNTVTVSPTEIKDYLISSSFDQAHATYEPGIGQYIKEKYLQVDRAKDSQNNSKIYVFIIDEINRGEISKIFGELFFSIDPGYRGEKGKIKTQYQNLVDDKDVFAKGFYIPENVYIIGTMNDIDRSVESMDFAMRRRFAFKEIKADDRIEMLDSLKCGKKNEAVKCMRALNNEIEKISGLSSAYHIGPAYFLKLDNYEGNFEDLWKYHIEGVLREYLRGMPKATNLLTKLKDEYDKSIASGLSASSDDASGSAENP